MCLLGPACSCQPVPSRPFARAGNPDRSCAMGSGHPASCYSYQGMHKLSWGCLAWICPPLPAQNAPCKQLRAWHPARSGAGAGVGVWAAESRPGSDLKGSRAWGAHGDGIQSCSGPARQPAGMRYDGVPPLLLLRGGHRAQEGKGGAPCPADARRDQASCMPGHPRNQAGHQTPAPESRGIRGTPLHPSAPSLLCRHGEPALLHVSITPGAPAAPAASRPSISPFLKGREFATSRPPRSRPCLQITPPGTAGSQLSSKAASERAGGDPGGLLLFISG